MVDRLPDRGDIKDKVLLHIDVLGEASQRQLEKLQRYAGRLFAGKSVIVVPTEAVAETPRPVGGRLPDVTAELVEFAELDLSKSVPS